jgi:hypothetical protein
MMRSIRSLVALAALAPAAALAQGRFEGVITARMTAGQGGTDVAYSVKGDQFRMDVAGRSGMSMYMLYDAAKTSTLMVMPTQRMYMEMGQVGAEQQGDRKVPDIKMTGKKETIAGYECEHMLITSDNEQWDVCAAKGIASFRAMTNPMGRGAPAAVNAWQRLGKDMFPLKVVKPGAEVTFEVTKIEKKSLDNSLFAVPDGFTKMDMGGMGRRGRPPV